MRTGLQRVMSYFRTDVNRALLSMLRIIKHMPHACQAVTEAQAPEHRDNEPASWGLFCCKQISSDGPVASAHSWEMWRWDPRPVWSLIKDAAGGAGQMALYFISQVVSCFLFFSTYSRFPLPSLATAHMSFSVLLEWCVTLSLSMESPGRTTL